MQTTGGQGPRSDRPKRRVFTAEYKRAIVAEYDGLTEPGARGALLRREGLYHSHLIEWRRARDAGALGGVHSDRFVDKAPAQVWATLLDEGRYLCSESTMYRLLRANGEVRERRRQATHPPRVRPLDTVVGAEEALVPARVYDVIPHVHDGHEEVGYLVAIGWPLVADIPGVRMRAGWASGGHQHLALGW